MFEGYIANKYPGECALCGKRVRAKDGCAWLDGAWHVAHSPCIAGAIAAGREPRKAGINTPAAARIKAIRAALKTITVDAPVAELEKALAQVRAIVTEGPAPECPVCLEARVEREAMQHELDATDAEIHGFAVEGA